jgi:hypothetical protein
MGRGLFFILVFLHSISSYAKFQLAFCVDISGSANGVLTEVNQSIWSLGNQFTKSDEKLQLAMVGYGRNSCNQFQGNIEILSDFKEDLFSLGHLIMRKTVNTEGGVQANHFEALKIAIKKLKWDQSPEVKKKLVAIVNGDVQYQRMKKVRDWLDKQDISLSIIYFDGQVGKSYAQKWQALSKELNVSGYLVKNEQLSVSFKMNYDKSYLNELRSDFLSTIISFGKEGHRFELDLNYLVENASQTSISLENQIVEYMLSREFQVYMSKFDLVAAYMLNPESVTMIDEDELPAMLRGFSEEQLKRYLQIKASQRRLLMKKLNIESDRRTNFMIKQILKSQNFSNQNVFEIILIEVNKSYPIITASLK